MTHTIENWTFGLIPEPRESKDAPPKRIVALFGYDLDGIFIAGTDRIVSYSDAARMAKTENGDWYVLGEPDRFTTVDSLKAAIEQWAVKR